MVYVGDMVVNWFGLWLGKGWLLRRVDERAPLKGRSWVV
jgi:hypothetical protein